MVATGGGCGGGWMMVALAGYFSLLVGNFGCLLMGWPVLVEGACLLVLWWYKT